MVYKLKVLKIIGIIILENLDIYVELKLDDEIFNDIENLVEEKINFVEQIQRKKEEFLKECKQ